MAAQFFSVNFLRSTLDGTNTADGSKKTQVDRPLANLQDVQEFRGVDYLSKADPSECRPS